jgi:hypothetical protein
VHLLNANSESPHAVEDVVSTLHPFDRCAAVGVGIDVRDDRRAQLRNARVRSPFEGFLGQQSKESLHQIESRGLGWRELHPPGRTLTLNQHSDVRPSSASH